MQMKSCASERPASYPALAKIVLDSRTRQCSGKTVAVKSGVTSDLILSSRYIGE